MEDKCVRTYRELVYFGIFVLLAVAGCYLLMVYQVNISQHHWCDALNTLTQNKIATPVNPAQNPSRVEAYNLYQEFIQLKGEFGCG
jgi:hypothetical protein